MKRSLIFMGVLLLSVATQVPAMEYTTLGDISIGFDGYYRVRGEWFGFSEEGYHTIDFFDMRLRLATQMEFGEKVRIITEINGLKNVLWGKNENGNLFSQDMTNHKRTIGGPTAFQGGTLAHDAIELTRAYAEVNLPIGTLRFGRMPSNWGMGLLSNDGNDWDDDTGDTFDRVLFATKPLGKDSPFTIALIYSQIVEGNESIAEDDVEEWVLVPFYTSGDLFLGAYFMYRHQSAHMGTAGLTGDAQVFIIDLYGRAKFGNFFIESEMLYGTGSFDLFLGRHIDDVDAMGFNGVIKGGYDAEKWLAEGEIGWQSGGDEDQMATNASGSLYPETFGTLAIDGNYRPDLIMFREQFALFTANAGLPVLDDSGGSISNAWYVKVDGKYQIVDSLSINAALIYGSVIEPKVYGGPRLPDDIDESLGIEIDLWLHYTFMERFNWAVYLGYYAAGGFYEDMRELGIGTSVTEDNIWTLQTKMWVNI